jgi:hypothetical protein
VITGVQIVTSSAEDRPYAIFDGIAEQAASKLGGWKGTALAIGYDLTGGSKRALQAMALSGAIQEFNQAITQCHGVSVPP